ncbi:serine/threonine phosphatase PrpC [Labilithrix luteola]|uniref:Serine/threonine phosphatase PrpC n=1 Tax=Labilithrix luteola TaxID=1391654 RepID=A0A0K1QDI3_9BACT|nr:PP2C family serine/threonine-protein phosphatase [Labilithrix luteola]AKV03778.1 serine/threonine phosphatase PrpC [Labilithrix luteola]
MFDHPQELIVAVALLGIFVVTLVVSGNGRRAPVTGRSEDEKPVKTTRRDSKPAPARSTPPSKPAPARSESHLPLLCFDEDEEEVDPTRIGNSPKRAQLTPPTQTILYDEDAAVDEPTQARALILVTASGRTDRGLRRKNNEDALLALEDEGLFVIADGMGGYRGGEVASALAIQTIEQAFKDSDFQGQPHESIPRRASELARAIQMANDAILTQAAENRQLEGMGTTVCAARFLPNKQRVYLGHVGDSRSYRLRDGRLRRMTSDHTMRDELGITGEGAAHLSRAVGIWPTVAIDVVLAKPRPGDVYLLCSDGLTKMVDDAKIEQVLVELPTPKEMAEALVRLANENGGLDNVSVIVVRVEEVDAHHPRRAA